MSNKAAEYKNQNPRAGAFSYLCAVLAVCLCTILAKVVLLPFLELSNIVMTYLLAVALLAAKLGRGPAILASFLSVACFDYFCLRPYFTFAVHDTQYVVTFGVMLAVALIISNMTVTIKQQAEEARTREIRTAALYSMSRELSSTLDRESLIHAGLKHIEETFESAALLLMPVNDGSLRPCQVNPEQSCPNYDLELADWVYRNKSAKGFCDPEKVVLPEIYLPLIGAEQTIGVLVVNPGAKARFRSAEEQRMLETYANQLALACERAFLSEKSEQARLMVKTEQLRSSLLSSVSHDLRTPLATISGAASSIIEGSASFDLENCKEMAREIYQESMRLNRLVGNLLNMTRLESGSLNLALELHPVDEIVGAALGAFDAKFCSHKIVTRLPADLHLARVDAILIQQVLLNLIENAMKYTPAGTEIEISAITAPDKMIEISVSDRGPGIKPEFHKKVFEKFFRVDQNSTGAGLGLSICSGIIEAHGGKIWVEEREEGGSVFKFTVQAIEERFTGELDDEITALEAAP